MVWVVNRRKVLFRRLRFQTLATVKRAKITNERCPVGKWNHACKEYWTNTPPPIMGRDILACESCPIGKSWDKNKPYTTSGTHGGFVAECIGLIQGTHHTSVMNKGCFFLITILKKAKKGVK